MKTKKIKSKNITLHVILGIVAALGTVHADEPTAKRHGVNDKDILSSSPYDRDLYVLDEDSTSSDSDKKTYVLEFFDAPLADHRASLLQRSTSTQTAIAQKRSGATISAQNRIAIQRLTSDLRAQKRRVHAEQDSFLQQLGDILQQPTQAVSRTQYRTAARRGTAAATSNSNVLVYERRMHTLFNALVMSLDEDQLAKIKASGRVKHIEEDLTVRAFVEDAAEMIQVYDVRQYVNDKGVALDGTGMTIGIIDTGVDYNHADLGECFGAGCRVVGGYDFINDDDDPMDDHGHGTHVAGIAAGNGTVKGIAPNARIYAYKVLSAGGSGSSSAVANGVEACVDPNQDGDFSDHLDVCNMSLGSSNGNPDDLLSRAVDKAVQNGVVFAVAAGNDGPHARTIGSPGVARHALTVGAGCKTEHAQTDRCKDSGGVLANFSSRGPVVWEGGTINKPDIIVPGHVICAAKAKAMGSGRGQCVDAEHVYLSGTSMAAPVVAGAVALLRQAHPELSPLEIKQILMETASPAGLGQNHEGAGLLQAKDALVFMGIPSSALEIQGLPVVVKDNANQSNANYSKTITVKNTHGQMLAMQIKHISVPGIVVSLSPSTFQLESDQEQQVTVNYAIDHQEVLPGRYNIDLELSATGIPSVTVGSYVEIPAYITVSHQHLDFGLVSPEKDKEERSLSLTLKNRLQNIDIDYQVSSQMDSTGLQLSSNSSISVPAGGEVQLQFNLQVNNAQVAAGDHKGKIQLSSSRGDISISTFVYKGYGFVFHYPEESTADITAYTPALGKAKEIYTRSGSNQLKFYTTYKGPWTFITSLDGRYFIVQDEVQGEAEIQDINIDYAQAKNKLTITNRGIGGDPMGVLTEWAVTHRESGSASQFFIVGGKDIVPEFYINDIDKRFSFSYIGVVGAITQINELREMPHVFSYALTQGITQSQVFDNSPQDLKGYPLYTDGGDETLRIYSFVSNRYHHKRIVRYSWGGVTEYPMPSSGILPVYFYSHMSESPADSAYPDFPFVIFAPKKWLGDLAQDEHDYLIRSPNISFYNNNLYHWYPEVENNLITLGNFDRYLQLRKAPHQSSGTLPLLEGLPTAFTGRWLVDSGTTSGKLKASKHKSGGYYFTAGNGHTEVSSLPAVYDYQLSRDGQVFKQGGSASSAEIGFSSFGGQLGPGEYRLSVQQQSPYTGPLTNLPTTVDFTVYSPEQVANGQVDANAPVLHGASILGDGIAQGVVDVSKKPRVSVIVTPNPGLVSTDWGAMRREWVEDTIGEVSLAQSTDGQDWQPLTLQAMARGEYQADIATDLDAAVYYFKLQASDKAGNRLETVFAAPAGTGISGERVFSVLAGGDCETSNPELSVTPRTQSSLHGVPAIYNITIKNTNSATCGISSFKLETRFSSDPYTASFNQPVSFELAPGEQVQRTLSVIPDNDIPLNAKRSRPISIRDNTFNNERSLLVEHVLKQGDNQCHPAEHTVSLSPTTQAAEAGDEREYTLTIHNLDQGNCEDKSIELTFLGQDLTGSLFSDNVNLAAQDSTSVTLSVKSDTAAEPASYPFSVLSDSGQHAVTARGQLQITDPCERGQPQIVLSPKEQQVVAGNSEDYSLTVTSGDNAACAAREYAVSGQSDDLSLRIIDSDFSLAPKEVKQLTVTATAAAELAAGRYGFTVQVAAGNQQASDSAELLVQRACERKAARVILNPVQQSATAGDIKRYQLTVENLDKDCEQQVFNLSATTGLEAVLQPQSLTLAAGDSDEATVTVSSKTTQAVGDYPFTVVVQPTVGQQQQTTGHYVIAPPDCTRQPLSVTLDSEFDVAKPGQWLDHKLIVKNNDSDCPATTVTLDATLPQGILWQGEASLTLESGKQSEHILRTGSQADTPEGQYQISLRLSSPHHTNVTRTLNHRVESQSQACVRKTPKMTVNPPQHSGRFGQVRSYEIVLQNLDEGDCSAVNYRLDLDKPNGFISILSKRAVTLKARGSQTITAYALPLGAPKGITTFTTHARALTAGAKATQQYFTYRVL